MEPRTAASSSRRAPAGVAASTALAVALAALGAGGVAAPAPLADAATGTVYDAFEDFSASSNPTPGGIWTYGSTPTLGGTLTAYSWSGSRFGASAWQPSAGQEDPNVIGNKSGVDSTGAFVPTSTYLFVHPGPNGEYSVVRWTAPGPGSISVDAGFRSLVKDGGNATTDVHVLHNGVELAGGDIDATYWDGDIVTYSGSLSVSAGDTLDFAVGYGSYDYYADHTGVRVTITTASADPPPAPMDLVAVPGGTSTVLLKWSDNNSGELGFEVHRRAGDGELDFLAMTPPDATSFEDTGLPPNSPFTYAVRAVGTARVSGFAEATVTTLPTMSVITLRGDLRDSAAFAMDSFRATASYEFMDGVSDGALDPVAEGMTLRAGSEAAPILLKLSPFVEGWRKKGARWTWTSPRGSLTSYRVQVDTERRLVTIAVKGLEFAAPTVNPIRVSILVGDDGGTDWREWSATRKPGDLRLR